MSKIKKSHVKISKRFAHDLKKYNFVENERKKQKKIKELIETMKALQIIGEDKSELYLQSSSELQRLLCA